jgi:hypothetical protein
MTADNKQDGALIQANGEASTLQIPPVQQAAGARRKRWREQKADEPEEIPASEVRSLSHDEEARAQAEAAMERLLASSKGKPRRNR